MATHGQKEFGGKMPMNSVKIPNAYPCGCPADPPRRNDAAQFTEWGCCSVAGDGMVTRPIYCVSNNLLKGHRCVYRDMMECAPPSWTGGGGGVGWLFFGSWFQILSHLHPLPQRWISNRFEIAAPANYLIALVLTPLELGSDPAMTQWRQGSVRAGLLWWGVNP